MGDVESREQEARDIMQEAAEAGVPAGWYVLQPDPPKECGTCFGEGVVEQDQQVQEVGKVAVQVPCPDCSLEALVVCRECSEGKHGNCDGTTWSNLLGTIVDCGCERCS